MEQLCVTVRPHGDPRSYEQVLSLIADRYGNGLYQEVHEGDPADIEVRISRPELDPICILDAFRHEALRRKLIAELGKSRVDFCLEPGQKRQRVFDEIASSFPHSMRHWLKTTIPANLAAQAPDRVTIRGLFEFED